MNDDNTILRHMKPAAVLNEIAANPGAFRNDDSFTDDRMADFRVRPHSHP